MKTNPVSRHMFSLSEMTDGTMVIVNMTRIALWSIYPGRQVHAMTSN